MTDEIEPKKKKPKHYAGGCRECGGYEANVVSEWLGEDENGVGWWRLVDVCEDCGNVLEYRLPG